MDWIEREAWGDALRETFTPTADAMDDDFARLLAMMTEIEADPIPDSK